MLQVNNEWLVKPKKESEMQLGRVIKRYTVNNTNKNHQFNAISECGNLIEGFKKSIKEIDIDLMIIGRKKQIGRASEKYSRNTKRIIENIRECPVMIVPSSAEIQKQPEFVLVSNFEDELPNSEIENWYDLVVIAKGSFKIVTLSGKDNMTQLQKLNQKRVLQLLETVSGNPKHVEYLETALDLKNFANYHSDYIICLIDRKPDYWRKMGLSNSHIINIGPLPNTPLIALHR